MTKELRAEVLYLMLGETEQQFVENCARIISKHGLIRMGAAILRMDVKKASKKLQDMVQPTEKELQLA